MGLTRQPLADLEIRGLTADSRAVGPGYLFAALRGERDDGRRFIADAIKAGAVAILAEPGTTVEDRGAVLVESDNPRRELALLAARFYAPQPKTIAAVTGTSGKTSVAWFTRQIWLALGHKAVSLGTLGIVGNGGKAKLDHTTPDPVALHAALSELARSGIDHLAIEASSHGLAQYRLDGLALAAAAFTNLSRDHLDYHADMTQYLAAKRRLFAWLLPSGGAAVLNRDIPEFEGLRALCLKRGHRILSYGTAEEAELRLVARAPHATGQRVRIAVLGKQHDFDLPLVGGYQALNALCALGLAIGSGADAERATEALSVLTVVPGRVELVARHPSGAPIFVDYAHKPDALRAVLEALRPHAAGKLVVVFGCGGDRDAGKRPEMGEIAVRLADRVFVTDDNPRSEDPAAIRRAILAGAPGAIEIGDRGDAIRQAVAGLEKGDLLVLAGKGHEQGQIVGGETRPFDDAVEARAAVAELRRAR
ncbi:MAG: UDP-N-acetylmuramoyl-L-alanyl-D-glutamate--2,6-diaminopimelate ligase [Alphaproteobacteria bacterium]|nr:UDP-N-acetylmuramoyl-L-alanyl-D-glutamate--2,6-diaminopimelate ligase [Alphaproteobacteria bacterium]